MPDVKWYSAAAASITGSGATDRLALWSGTSALSSDADITFSGVTLSLAATGVIDWGAGDVTLTGGTNTLTFAGGQLILPAGTVALPSVVSGANNLGIFFDDANFLIQFARAGTSVATFSYNTGWVTTSDRGYNFVAGSSLTVTPDTALNRQAAGVVSVTDAGATTNYRDLIVRGLALGQSPIASNYLVITGSSGAGGTPTTTQLTAGSGVAIYTQDAHDAAATKLVFAYNLGGSMRYVTVPLDGTTTTWTHSATRP
jgi:hypothetical protein